jgi:hypothetical protein
MGGGGTIQPFEVDGRRNQSLHQHSEGYINASGKKFDTGTKFHRKLHNLKKII